MANQQKRKEARHFGGKIANLPQEMKDGVNELLREGASYRRVQEWLKERQHEVHVCSVKTWHNRGHQQWLKERERLGEMKFRKECVMEITENRSGESIHEASLRLAASQLYDVFSDFDIKALNQMLKEKPENYASLLAVLTRLSKGCLDIEKFKANVAEQKRKIEAQLGAAKKGGGLTEEGIGAIREALNLL